MRPVRLKSNYLLRDCQLLFATGKEECRRSSQIWELVVVYQDTATTATTIDSTAPPLRAGAATTQEGKCAGNAELARSCGATAPQKSLCNFRGAIISPVTHVGKSGPLEPENTHMDMVLCVCPPKTANQRYWAFRRFQWIIAAAQRALYEREVNQQARPHH